MKELVKQSFLFEEWKFTTRDEAIEEAKKEAYVCGDEVQSEEGAIIIHNFHAGRIRWRGRFERRN